MLQTNAAVQDLPLRFFLRLIWRESRFDHKAVSRAGAQGIAQFMPKTAEMWGLHDPFDPVQALQKSAELLASLTADFGNIGLAAAAYNAGPGRVQKWLKGRSRLPKETRDYVAYITGKPANFWRKTSVHTAKVETKLEPPQGDLYSYSLEDSCLELAEKTKKEPWSRSSWSVRLVEDVSQTEARREIAYLKSLKSLAKGAKPLVEPLEKAEQDGRPRFAVDLGFRTRKQAWAHCSKLRKQGEECRILRVASQVPQRANDGSEREIAGT